MGFLIESGTCHGYEAGVTARNQLQTRSITVPRMSEATHEGQGYFISTGEIALTTTASFNGMLTFTPTKDTHINRIILTANVQCAWQIMVSSSAGTLFSAGVAASSLNLNLGSTNVIQATTLLKANADALTVTNGTIRLNMFTGAYSNIIMPVDESILLSPESNITIMAKPQAAGDCCVNMMVHQDDVIN